MYVYAEREQEREEERYRGRERIWEQSWPNSRDWCASLTHPSPLTQPI